MNTAKEAKRELTKTPSSSCCKAAFLSAVFHTAGIISITKDGMRIIIESVNPLLEDVVWDIIGSLFGADDKNNGAKVLVDNNKDSHDSGKIVISGDFVPEMLLDLRILKLAGGLKLVEGIDHFLIGDECCKRAYLAGAFVGGGTLITAKGYHLEFACASKKLRDDCLRLLLEFEIKAAALNRGQKYLAYIKNSDMVSDCLAFMGAVKSVLKLNSLVAERSLSRDVSRAANCDIANLNRLVSASIKQRNAIAVLGFIQDAKLAATAEARMKHPEANYEELAVVLGVSKSTVRYRLEQLVKMAEKNS